MTNKKPITRRNAPARQFTKLDAATLSNMSHQSAPVGVGPNNAALQPITEILTKLSPSNLHLVESIIRVIVDEQARDSS
ncbi:hypothetical protein H3H36_15680 [Duganella sp. FT3S]|uniref:Uncharacterized protein n=1 Tax=Rugamonas fusca TaxID=2758568 RepID=A0A7W2I7N7_9BURK|nr:hypothetical protein [Rugamonas fusca]MBA5606797.1 hypothetical protein [Rugamonas fusca]